VALDQSLDAAQFISYECSNGKHIRMEIVKKKGGYLKFASEHLKYDKELVLTAIHQDFRAIQHASYNFKK
jgi:hypothetical protein